jgi:hypothetical protein
MISIFRLRTVLVVIGTAMAIAAAAGCGITPASTAARTAGVQRHTHHTRPHQAHAQGRHHGHDPGPRHTHARTPRPAAKARHSPKPSYNPKPSHNPTPSHSPPPTPSPVPTGHTHACVTSKAMGMCHFRHYSEATGVVSSGVGQDVWASIPGWHQTLYASDLGHWQVRAKMPAGNTAVVSYPDAGVYFNKSVSKYTSIVSSFTDRIPLGSGTNAEASYDIWFNDSSINEVMIQNDFSRGRTPSCDWAARRVRFGGEHGVPVHLWNLCVSGSAAYWVIATGDMPSGSVNILAMLKWLVRHGQLPKGVEITGCGYGFEISSTGGRYETFRVSRYTMAASS